MGKIEEEFNDNLLFKQLVAIKVVFGRITTKDKQLPTQHTVKTLYK